MALHPDRLLSALCGSAESSQQLQVISQLRKVRKDKKVEAVVLRVDSPGGDALASDLMWHEIRRCAEKKPVIASMADVAASGMQSSQPQLVP